MARAAAAAANPASSGGATTSAGGAAPAGAAGRISGTFSRTQLNEPPPVLRSVQSFKAPGAQGGQGGAAGGSGGAGQGPEPSGGSGTAAGAGQGLRRERPPLPYVTLWDEHLALAEAQVDYVRERGGGHVPRAMSRLPRILLVLGSSWGASGVPNARSVCAHSSCTGD